MEEKKFDINTVVGFLLIGGILLYMLWQNAPTPEELEAQQAEKEKIEQLENPETLDKFAREKYNMKKEDEEIYIIEYDTLKKR